MVAFVVMAVAVKLGLLQQKKTQKADQQREEERLGVTAALKGFRQAH